MRHLATACVLLALGMTPLPAGALTHEELQWEGYRQPRDRVQRLPVAREERRPCSAPANNYFSESEDNIRVDEQGRLHLRITHARRQVVLPGAGARRTRSVTATTSSRPSAAWTGSIRNLILGLFIWEYQEDYSSNDVYNGANEFDIEFGAWKDPSATGPVRLPAVADRRATSTGSTSRSTATTRSRRTRSSGIRAAWLPELARARGHPESVRR